MTIIFKCKMVVVNTILHKLLQLTIFGTLLSISIYVYLWNYTPICEEDEQYLMDAKYFTFVTNKETIVFRKLIKGFMELLPNVTYLMMYGTLLGSYRHHGMIPWDADVDFVIRGRDMEAARNIFTSLQPDSEFKFKPHSKFIWRFFHKESEETGSPWKWPYIDIYFYSENSTHIWNSDIPEPKFEKSLIFPLIKRPFMGYLLPAPRFPKTVLEKSYDLNTCVWTYHQMPDSHPKMKTCLRVKRFPCEFLYHTFPFVKRRDNGSGIVETLERENVEVKGSTAYFIEK